MVGLLVTGHGHGKSAHGHGRHISLIVSSKVTIWRDDIVDLRFVVSHAELWSQQVALDVFCH